MSSALKIKCYKSDLNPPEKAFSQRVLCRFPSVVESAASTQARSGRDLQALASHDETGQCVELSSLCTLHKACLLSLTAFVLAATYKEIGRGSAFKG